MPFSDINKAFQLLEEGKSLRCLLNFWWGGGGIQDSCLFQCNNNKSSRETFSSVHL
jgi:hypothetical protein